MTMLFVAIVVLEIAGYVIYEMNFSRGMLLFGAFFHRRRQSKYDLVSTNASGPLPEVKNTVKESKGRGSYCWLQNGLPEAPNGIHRL
jgi:hypothetical protein